MACVLTARSLYRTCERVKNIFKKIFEIPMKYIHFLSRRISYSYFLIFLAV